MSRMRVKGTDAVYASVKDGSLQSQGHPALSTASLPRSVHGTQMEFAACKRLGSREGSAEDGGGTGHLGCMRRARRAGVLAAAGSPMTLSRDVKMTRDSSACLLGR